MKIKSWHISTLLLVGVFVGVLFTAGSGNTGIGAVLMLSLLPLLVWFGWTLNDRSQFKSIQLEQRIRERIRERNPEEIMLDRRKVKDSV